MKKRILTFIAATAILFSACKKDDNNDPSGETGNYQPLTTGSTWSYRSTTTVPQGTVNQTEVDTTVSTVTATTKVFDGKTFRLIKGVTDGETTDSYFAIVNGVYYNRNVDEDTEFEIAYLNESAAAGTSTVTPLQFEGAEAQLKTTVVEKGANKVVLGKTYGNIIHTKVEVQLKAAGQWKTTGSTDYYVAKGVGVIALTVSLNGTEIEKSELISYNIK